MCLCRCVRLCVYVCAHILARMYACIHTNLYEHSYLHVYVCVRVCECVSVSCICMLCYLTLLNFVFCASLYERTVFSGDVDKSIVSFVFFACMCFLCRGRST